MQCSARGALNWNIRKIKGAPKTTAHRGRGLYGWNEIENSARVALMK